MLCIQDFDEKYFICSIYQDKKKSKVQLWDKNLLKLNEEIEVNELMNKLEIIPNTQTLVGCRQNKGTFTKLLYFIDLEKKGVKTFKQDDDVNDFSVLSNGQVFALIQDKLMENNRLVGFRSPQANQPLYGVHCKSIFSTDSIVSTLFEHNEQKKIAGSPDKNANGDHVKVEKTQSNNNSNN